MIFIGQLSPGDRGWCAYLLPQGVTYTKDTLELDQVFYERYGSFLFSSEEVSLDTKEKANEFVSSIKSYIASRHASYRHLLWADDFSNPEGICGISFFNNKMTSAAKWRISSSLNLHWEVGCSISYDATRKCLSIKGRGGLNSPMYIAKNYPDGKDGKHYPTQEIRLFLNSGSKGCLELGCLEFDLTLSLNGDFDDLDFGLRYFAYDKINKRVCSQRYPLLSHASTNVGLKVRLDPTCYLNHDRNFWAFDRAGSPLPSAFITTTGHRIMITPVAANSPGTSSPARMVFIRKISTPSDDFYLADPALAPKIDAFLERLLATSWITNLNRDRNFWAFDWASPPLQSPFITKMGHRVMIAPAVANCPSPSAPAKMVFARKSTTLDDDFYLMPQGDFILSIQEPPNNVTTFDLLCGLEGMESITLRPKPAAIQGTGGSEGEILRFISKKPAYATAFGAEGDLNEPDGDLLTEELTTSWAAVLPGGGGPKAGDPAPLPRYNSQPKGAPLYAKKGGDILEFYQLGTDLTSACDLSYPLVPYSEMTPDPVDGFGPDEVRRFEAEVISPARRREIRAATQSTRTAATRGAADISCATPQGFIVTIRGDGSYSKVHLAHTKESDLLFSEVQKPLQNALQTNQLFLVATGGTGLGKPDTASDSAGDGEPRFQNHISIDGWEFRVRLPERPEPGNYRNVVILKFCRGSLREMAGRPDLWMDPGEFNDPSQVEMVSDWLQRYIDDAVASEGSKGDPAGKSGLFAKFAEIAMNPDWNGILFLKVDIEDLPRNLGGLFAGIVGESFTAHHIGIEANKIDSKSAAISEESSVFGSIWYRDEGYTPGTAADCDFRVTEIKALFEKSAIKDFGSKAMLTVNRFMDHPVLSAKIGQAYSAYNVIPFHGSCQKKEDGSTVYVIDAEEDCSFYLDSNVLRKVEVVKAQMSTAEEDAGGESVTRFDLQGFMDFCVLKYEPPNAGAAKAFDIFSYGNEEGKDEAKKGLYFSGLGIDMSYTKGAEAEKEFSFDLSRVGFDPGKSTARKGGLVKQFALDMDALVSSDEKSKPSDQGFLEVKLGRDSLSLSGLKGPWRGLRFRLNMGTLGELAGKAGLTSELLLAWSCGGSLDAQTDGGSDAKSGEESYAAFIGIKLPGAGGGTKVFDLQGMLKLSIDNIRLACIDVADKVGVKKRIFLLVLTRIALKLLGVMKIPPGGSTSFYLFGNPEADSGVKGLGWYAMYGKDVKSEA